MNTETTKPSTREPAFACSDFTPRYSITEAGVRALDEHAARIPYVLTERATEALRGLR